MSASFADRIEEYISRRAVANRVRKVKCPRFGMNPRVVDGGNQRGNRLRNALTVGNIPIFHGSFRVMGMDRPGKTKEVAWDIHRSIHDPLLTLEQIAESGDP
jgi:hypothetical protein